MKHLKKISSIVLLTFVLLASVFAFGCNDTQEQTTEPPKFSLSQTSMIMYVFDTATLSIENGSDEIITWSCTDESVAEIIPNGKTVTLKAIRRGEISIIATQGKNSASCLVNVFPAFKDFSVALNSAENAQLKVGETYSLIATATFDGQEFTGAELEYAVIQSSPAGSVSIDENGLVTALVQGTATVGVRALYGDTYSEWVLVTVYVFPTDYDNDDQKQPSLEDGGYIEDVFDTEEIIPEPPEGGFIEDVFGE